MANIRTIDYKGSNSASAGTGPKGWMFWSGSETIGGQAYSGLGMEMMDTSESYLKFTTEGDGDLDIRAKKFYVGTPDSQFISGSDGAIEISSSNFHLTGGNVIMAGDITANTGNIGGWHIASTALTASNIILSSSGTIQTSDFQSSLLGTGKGWKIGSDGVAEFEEARIRGTLSTAVFEKDTISAVGGQVIIANATTITGSEVLYPGVTAQTINVANAGGFVHAEYLIAKATASAGFTTEMMLVSSVNSSSTPNTITLVRNANSSTYIPTMSSGQVLVSQGASGYGYIHMNADPTDSATPYIDIVERTGSAIGDIKIKARLGDLSGLAGVGPVSADPGFGLYSENVFLSGTITASAGEIGGWEIGANNLTAGNMEMSSSGLITTNTDTSKTRIVIDGSTDPSEIRFFSGSVSKFEMTTDIMALPEQSMTRGTSSPTCPALGSSGISGIQLNHKQSGIVSSLGAAVSEIISIVPGRIYVHGRNSSSAAANTEQLKIRRDITNCGSGGSEPDTNSRTSAALFEYQGSINDTNANYRCAAIGDASITNALSLATPISFFAQANTANSGKTAYSFWGASGSMYNNDGVALGIDDHPGSVQLKVKMDRDDGPVCSIQNVDTGPSGSGLSIRLDKSIPIASNKYITFLRGNGYPAGYVQGVPLQEWQVDFANASDKRLKSNIRDVKYGLRDLLKIKVRDYEFNGAKHTSTGFIAQELHEVWQNGVGKTDNGTDPLPPGNSKDFMPWTVDYAKITPLLVKSVQDQQKIIDELTKRLEKLEQG